MRVQRAMVWAGSILCAIGSSAIAIIASATGFTPGTAQLTTALPIASVFFGLSVLDYKKTNPLLIFGTTRTWDAYPALDWAEANPAAGQYNFAPLNSYIATNMSRGRQILYTFGRTPRWASTAPDAVGPYGPGQCAPPVISAWDQYVAAIVTNAAGRIKYWELWNEPDQASSYCGDLATMVTMAQHAYRIIKSIDPSAMVLSPAAGGRAGARWLDSYVKAGGLHTFDIVAFHGYEGAQAERIIAIVDAYRLVLSHHHLSAMPLWDTECSWGESNIGDDTHRAAFLSTYFFLQWSKGVDRVLWYAYDGDRKWGRLIDTANNLLPEGVAYGETYKWIVGATMTQLCAQDQNGTWTCSITRPGGYKAQVVWNSIAASSLNFSAPAQMTEYRDLSGGVHPIVGGTVQVQNLPILLETGPGPH